MYQVPQLDESYDATLKTHIGPTILCYILILQLCLILFHLKYKFKYF